MIYKRFSKKTKIIIAIATLLVLLASVIGYFALKPKNPLSNKPNPTPGSGKAESSAAKEVEKKQTEQTQKLNKQLAEAPKDPKTRCVITAKFNTEQRRDEQISAENKRNDEHIKKFGNNKSNGYIHKQNLDKIQKQYEREIKNINCK